MSNSWFCKQFGDVHVQIDFGYKNDFAVKSIWSVDKKGNFHLQDIEYIGTAKEFEDLNKRTEVLRQIDKEYGSK